MKKIFFTLVVLVAATAMQAQTITEHMARTMAIEFVQQKQITVAPQAEMVYRECGTRDAAPEVYLVRVGNATKQAANFVIMAADASVEDPILGYGFNADIDLDNAPENFKWWIRQYALQIEYAKENGLLTATNATTARYGVRKATGMGTVVVPPLLGDTRWHQDTPYNNLCPADSKQGGALSVVGCVATAMSQIMYYYKWPLQGTGKHKDQSTKTEEVDFSKSFYDWKNILPSYYKSATAAQCNAVAKLCYDCGVAVDMQYSAQGSGALSSDVAYAMKTYFKYKQPTYKTRGSATTTWDNLIKDELKAGRPVYYSGNDGTYGHAFVCDGYDSNNYFHFNWGWTGSCNGYFKTTALATDQGAFNYGQTINYNIQPNRTATVVGGLTYNLRNDSTAELTKKNGGFYSGDIEIPATITVGGIEYTVNTIGAYAFGNCTDLTSVTLSDAITTITASAFCNCSSLDKIVMPFTKPIEISTGAFSSDIYSTTTLVVPDNCIKNYSGAAPWFHFTYYSTPSTQFETEQYWTAWKPYLNGFGTWTYRNDPTMDKGTQHTNLRIFHRTSTSDANTQQFWIQSWSCDGDLLINYDEKTGNCVVPMAYTGYQAYEGGKVYASDCHEFNPGYTYKQYPCTFNKANGTFTLNMIYYISQGSFPKDGVETFKIDGSSDFSFEVAVGDIKLNETDGSGTSTLTFTEGKDVKYKKFYSVRRELNAKQVDTTMNRIISGAVEAEKLTKNTYDFKMPREGVYELFFCVYDSLDNCKYTTHNTLKFYTETGWTSLGKCEYTDDVITTTFSTKLTPAGPYKVEIFQNDLNKGILRLKHPYGTTFPYAKNGNYTKETIYVDIIVEDPEGVYIEYQSTGKDLQKKGVYSFIYSKAAEALDAGTSLEDVKKMGVCGTFDGRTITFPANAVYCDKYFTSEYTEANRNAAFKVDLSQLPVGIFDLNQQNENALNNIGAPVYNLSGQRVSKDYKGLLIHNGRKILKH